MGKIIIKTFIKTFLCAIFAAIVFWGISRLSVNPVQNRLYNQCVETQNREYEDSMAEYQTQMKEYEKRLAELKKKQNEDKKQIFEYNAKLIKTLGLNNSGLISTSVSLNCEQTNDDNIGSELNYYFYINGTEVSNGSTVQINVLEPIQISVSIIEADPSHDDTGEVSDEFIVALCDLFEGITFRWEVPISEHYGQYAGNTADYAGSITLKTVNYYALSQSEKYHPPFYTIPLKPAEPVKPIPPNKEAFLYSPLEAIKHSIGGIALFCLFSFSLLLLIIFQTASALSKEQERQRIKQFSKIQKQRFKEEKKNFINRVHGRSPSEICNIPNNIHFLQNGLPIDNNDTEFGSFTYYLSEHGTRYHKKIGCSSASIPCHAFKIDTYQYSPCSKCCRTEINIPEWYTEYQNLMLEAKHFEYSF